MSGTFLSRDNDTRRHQRIVSYDRRVRLNRLQTNYERIKKIKHDLSHPNLHGVPSSNFLEIVRRFSTVVHDAYVGVAQSRYCCACTCLYSVFSFVFGFKRPRINCNYTVCVCVCVYVSELRLLALCVHARETIGNPLTRASERAREACIIKYLANLFNINVRRKSA